MDLKNNINDITENFLFSSTFLQSSCPQSQLIAVSKGCNSNLIKIYHNQFNLIINRFNYHCCKFSMSTDFE